MSESKARAKRQNERFSVDSQYILVRGLIIHRTAMLTKKSINVDCLLDIEDMKAPDPRFLTSTKHRIKHQSDVFNRLKKRGRNVNWASRDAVTEFINGYIQDNRNFWAHAYIALDFDNNRILRMDNSPVYSNGLPVRDAATEGLRFLDDIEPVCEYIDTQYNNVHEFLRQEVLLRNDHKE